jgi:hypothetical protein
MLASFVGLCIMVLLVCTRINVTTLMHHYIVPLAIYDRSCVVIHGATSACVPHSVFT